MNTSCRNVPVSELDPSEPKPAPPRRATVSIARREKHPKRADFLHDLLASIVVFLVALPLCMGIALACGLPPTAGLISGIVGGIFVGALGGSPLQVTGPAAGLIVVVVEILGPYRLADGKLDLERALPALGAVLMLAGLIQFAAGLLRFGQWFRAVSPAVVRGMMAGIGVSIFATQFHLMLDDDRVRPSTVANLVSIPAAITSGILPLDGSRHHKAAAVGLVTIFMIALWKELPWKRVRMLPGALVGVLAAMLLANGLGWEISYVNLEGGLAGAVSFLDVGSMLPLLQESSIWIGAGTMALIASAETLLSAAAVDQMQHGPRTRYDRELSAQGLGNVICGFVGGLPMTGVIVRSSANVEAGARSRLSAVLHGFWLLAAVALFPHALEFIPRCALAAILVYSGYKLIDPKGVRELWHLGWGEVAIYFVTIAGIVVEGLLLGVLLGVVLAALRLLYMFTALHVDLESNDDDTTTVRLRGAATFLRLPKLAAALEQIPVAHQVHVDLSGMSFIDHGCHRLLVGWAAQYEQTGGRVHLDWQSLDARLRQDEPCRTIPPAGTPESEAA